MYALLINKLMQTNVNENKPLCETDQNSRRNEVMEEGPDIGALVPNHSRPDLRR